MADGRPPGLFDWSAPLLQGAGGVALTPYTLPGPLGARALPGVDGFAGRPDRLLVVRMALERQPALGNLTLPLLMSPPSASPPPRVPLPGLSLSEALVLDHANLDATWADVCHALLRQSGGLPSVQLVGPLSIDFDVFRALYERASAEDPHFRRKLAPDIVANLRTVMLRIQNDSALMNLRWIAYMLATALHENRSASRGWQAVWAPMPENGGRPYGGHVYFDPVEVRNAAGRYLGADGTELANQTDPKGRIRRAFHGRGFVQITWMENYAKFDRALGLGGTLLAEPDRALEFDVAYDIWSLGMRTGMFTGRRLSEFIAGVDVVDYVGARAIVNADRRVTSAGETLNNGELIARHARVFERILQSSRIV